MLTSAHLLSVCDGYDSSRCCCCCVFSVSSWDGGESLLDKEHAADRANRLKRCMSDLYDEEIDQGRVSGH